MGRPAKKRCRAEAKATRLGQLQAEYEFKKAHSVTKKPMDFLEETVKGTINKIDPLKAVAITGTTVIIHGLIQASDTMLTQIADFVSNIPQFLGGAVIGVAETIFSKASWEAIGVEVHEPKIEEPKTSTPKSHYQSILESLGISDLYVWIISFALAYIVIEHGGQLIGLLDKGLTSVVPMLLGVAA